MSNYFSQTSLLNWYKTHGRHELPWRKTDDIYHIYLSEVMLQQTQVSRVEEEYYPKFLTKYPTIKDLAEAKLEDVLADWSGLGYYRRATNIHKCANDAKEGLPKDLKTLLKLPGIGQYTASAICSFGLNQAVPVVDTNIARVIKRFFALRDVNDKEVLKTAEKFLNKVMPRDHNLALMDLGAMLCTPKSPQCNECPLVDNCKGKEKPEEFTQTKKTKYEALDLFYGVLIKDGKIALTPSTGNMYKGMLELPTIDPQEDKFLGKFKHSYTKYRLTVNLYEIDNFCGEIIWENLENARNLPISTLVKKALELINL